MTNIPGGHKVESVVEGNRNILINGEKTHATYTSVILPANTFFPENELGPALFLALICTEKRVHNELFQIG